MPFHPIHLAQTATARGWAKSVGTSAKDAQVINGLFEVATNPLLGTKTVYVVKRAGSNTGSTFATGVVVLKNTNSVYMNPLYATSSTFYANTAQALGTLTAAVLSKSNYVVADSVAGNAGVIAFTTSDASPVGWYFWVTAAINNFPTFQGDTHTNTVIDNITSTTGLYPGQLITGTGIQAGTRIATITSATAITTTIATTATATITITKEALAKIIDADWPTDANTMCAMDGYFFVGTARGDIWQSALNDPSSWASTDVVAADNYGDGINVIFKQNQYIVAAGFGGSVQYFYNAGNPSGSVLSPSHGLDLTGIQIENVPVPLWESGSYCNGKSGFPDVAGGAKSDQLIRLTGANTFTPIGDNFWWGIMGSLGLSLIGLAEIGDKQLVLIHGTNDTTVLAYDETVNMFSMLSMDAAITSSFGVRFTKSSGSAAYLWASDDTWTDSSSAFTLTIQTEPQDMNNGMDATDTWVDLLADNESTGAATLSYTDDDYANWVTAGTFDMTKTKKRINALGQHNARAYRVTHAANTGFRGQILRVNYAKGES